MTQAVQQLLAAFDSLDEVDKHAAAVEVLRRIWPHHIPELPDDVLIVAAEELFSDLDAREDADAQP